MGWLQLVGSIKLQVSFANETYKRDDILQKRPVILSILLTVATAYTHGCTCSACCNAVSTCAHLARTHPIHSIRVQWVTHAEYEYTYEYIYTYTYTHIHMYMYIHILTYISLSLIHMHNPQTENPGAMREACWIWIHIYIHIYICIYTYIYSHIHMYHWFACTTPRQ